MNKQFVLIITIAALAISSWGQSGPGSAPSVQSQRGVSMIQDNAASFLLRRKLNFVTPNALCVDNVSNASTDCNLGPWDFFADGNVTTSLGTLINSLISGSTFGGRIQDNIVGETWSTNPMPDNGFFKVTLKSGNGSGPAVRTSVPIVLNGGNRLIGNGRKGSPNTSEWVGTRIAPSASFPDSITPPAPAVSGFTCTGSSGSFAAGSYLVTTAFVDNLQTYSGTSTVVPGQTIAGTEAIVTCPASGTINVPAHTVSTGAFPTTNGFQVFWAKTVNATTTTSTTGASCAATPASCNVAIAVGAFTDSTWARGFSVGMDVLLDVGASQERQTVVAIDDVNSKLILKGPLGFAHTNPYPIAPSNSETLQNTTAAGIAGANTTCAGTNAGNNAYGGMHACTVSSGSSVSVTATLTSGAVNGGAPIPLLNYTAPIIVGGGAGLLGDAEFDAGVKGIQISCQRPNASTVANGMGFINLNIQEHGVLENFFAKDCADGWYMFGNQAQNSSVIMAEVNDGCATNKVVGGIGCTVAGSITNKNARMMVQNVLPGPLAIERLSSSSASCLNGGCNVTQFNGAVLVVDKSATVILGAHGEGALDVVKVQNGGSVLLENNSGGSSSNASTLNTVHIAWDARTSTIHNQIANGGISAVQDDIFKGASNITATALISGGATTITVSSTTGLNCDQELLLDTVASGVQEYVRIAPYTSSGTTLPALSQCISGSVVTLASGTVNAHSSGIIVQPTSTNVNEGTFTPTGWYQVSNSCPGCVNSNRDRFTSYNGVPSQIAGPSRFLSSVATDVPVQIGPGPGVTQTADLLDLYSDNLLSVLALKIGSDGTLFNNNSASWYVAGGGTAQAQTATLVPAVAALRPGLIVDWLPVAANTATAPTLAVNGLAAKPITKNGANALVAGDLTTTTIAKAIYDGTQFQLINPQRGYVLTGSTSGSVTHQVAAAAGSAIYIEASTSASGVIEGANSAGTITQGISGDANHSATVTIGSGTSIGLTSLCTTTFCAGGVYQITFYLDITTVCGTSGSYTVFLTWTDDTASKSAFTVPLAGTGTAAGVVTTTALANWGTASMTIRSTGAQPIQYSTTAVACGSAGPMVGKLYMSVLQLQ